MKKSVDLLLGTILVTSFVLLHFVLNANVYSFSQANNIEEEKIVFPASVDNSKLKCFPPIEDQGRLGSCAAFSTTYYQLTHMFGLLLDWDVKNDFENNKKFSPKWTFNLLNGGRNNGILVTDAYNLFLKSGAAKWNEFSYVNDGENSIDYKEWPVDGDIWKNALNYRIDDYGYVEIWDGSDTPVKNTESESLYEIKRLLNEGHVLVVSTNVSGWKISFVSDDISTIEDDEYVNQHIVYASGISSVLEDGHSMTVVGYNDHIWIDINNNGKVDDGEKGAFKIANSWGDKYLNEGFLWMSYDALNKVSAVKDNPHIDDRINAWRFNNYAYWIMPKINYTPKLMIEYKISTNNRYELKTLFGYSNKKSIQPSVFWNPDSINVFSLFDEVIGFDGNMGVSDATFVFDLTDLYDMYNNKDGYWYGYFTFYDIGMGAEFISVLKELRVIDLENSRTYEFYDLPVEIGLEPLIIGPIHVEKENYEVTRTTLKSNMISKRRDPQVVSINDKVYVIGGFEFGKGYVNTIEEYNAKTDSWIKITDLPGALISKPYATVIEDKIYILRRISENEGIIETYNPFKDKWQYKTHISYSSCQGIIEMKGKIYIIENNILDNENSQVRILQYDPSTNNIKVESLINSNLTYFFPIAEGTRVFLIGGKRGRERLGGFNENHYTQNVLMVYDTITKEWDVKTPLSDKYSCRGGVVIDGKIYVIYRYMNKLGIMEYDPHNDKWSYLKADISFRTNVGIGAFGSNIIVVGGDISTTTLSLFFNSDAVEIIKIKSDVLYGDVNGDGKIDSRDYVLLNRYILGIIDQFPCNNGITSADVDRNGQIDSTDYILLKRYLIEIIENLPV
ncbi:UNVERIFIED_CONTAM: C1A family cysteine protease [Acetivibrio alkalicellulosi]